MIQAPCMKCEDRCERCHSFCEKYIEYKAQKDRINTERFEANQKSHLAINYRRTPKRSKTNDFFNNKRSRS